MSRLFSRLEDIGHDQTDTVPPAESALKADTHADAASLVPSDDDTRTPDAGMPGQPAMAPLVPGYAIPSRLAVSPQLRPVAARPVWPVRLWLASLLLLIGLSLLMLALPEHLLPLAVQQRPAGAAPDVPAVSRPDATPARPAATPPASAVTGMVRPVPTAPAPRAEPRTTRPVATPAAPAPSQPNGSPACSEAMLAMSLCSKSSP